MASGKDNSIVTHTDEEFLAVCARKKRGELYYTHIAVGKTNGEWIFQNVSVPMKPDPDLFDYADSNTGTAASGSTPGPTPATGT